MRLLGKSLKTRFLRRAIADLDILYLIAKLMPSLLSRSKRPKRRSKMRSRPSSARLLHRLPSSPSLTETAHLTSWCMPTLTPMSPWSGVTATQRRSRTRRRSNCAASVRTTTGWVLWLATGWQIKDSKLYYEFPRGMLYALAFGGDTLIFKYRIRRSYALMSTAFCS